MRKFFSTISNIFSIEELRTRILNTLGFLIVFRLGSFITLPGIDPSKLVDNAGGIFGLLDTFLGGAFSNASIFGLGIMPYISASIVMQLLTVAVPYFQKLQKEGDSGRKKNQPNNKSIDIVYMYGSVSSLLDNNICRCYCTKRVFLPNLLYDHAHSRNGVLYVAWRKNN